MAKHERSGNGSYQLVRERRVNVKSAVRSLNNLPTGEGKVKVDPKFLVDGNGKYKFARTISVPCIRGEMVPDGNKRDQKGNPILTRREIANDENIAELVQQFMEDLRAYDAADEVVTTNGTKRGKRTIKLCAELDKDGNVVRELSAGEYIARCIMGEHILGLQKRFYKENQPKVYEAAYSGELTGEPYTRPIAKVRGAKVSTVEQEEETVS